MTPHLCRFDRLADAPVENGQIHKKYDIIQPDGLAGVGERVDPGDVYINKQTPANANDNSFTGQASAVSYKNSPMTYKSPISGNIDKVMITDTDNDQTLIKVLIRQTRRPELGDKFSSRHGQKGVCGLIVNQEDMPFNDQGICPGVCSQSVTCIPPVPGFGSPLLLDVLIFFEWPARGGGDPCSSRSSVQCRVWM